MFNCKNEDLYINDWSRYHLNLGFDHIFFIFDNNDNNFLIEIINDNIIEKIIFFDINKKKFNTI